MSSMFTKPSPGVVTKENAASSSATSRLQYFFKKAHLFDFVTCWSHWFLFCAVFNPFESLPTPSCVLVGARLSVISTSIFGTLILLARGRDCLPHIQEELYLHSPDLVLPFFKSLPVILAIDMLWHGLPFWIVLVSSAVPPPSLLLSLLNVGALGASFLLFEKARGISAGETYGLRGLGNGVTTPAVLTGIALTSLAFYGLACDPAPVLAGWERLLLGVGVLGPVARTRLAAFLLLSGEW